MYYFEYLILNGHYSNYPVNLRKHKNDFKSDGFTDIETRCGINVANLQQHEQTLSYTNQK